MVQGIGSGSQVGVVAVAALRYAQSGGPNVILPVRPADLVYANFRHIQVRPDTRFEDGIPLYKLKILDTLIDSFTRVAGEAAAAGSDAAGRPGAAVGAVGAMAGTSSGRRPVPSADTIDRLITSMAGELRSAGRGGAPYRARFLPEPGAFVGLAA
jgi:hypothetical protein